VASGLVPVDGPQKVGGLGVKYAEGGVAGAALLVLSLCFLPSFSGAQSAIWWLESGTAVGYNGIHPEILIHVSPGPPMVLSF
jgi:hypothetical protein